MTKEEANKYFLEEELNIKGDNKGHEEALDFINEQGEPAKDGEWMGVVKGMAKYAMQFPGEVGEEDTSEPPVEEPGPKDPETDPEKDNEEDLEV